jgi:hypothetical protein
MNLCSSGHDEVCYEGRTCPVCDLREDLEDSIKDLTKELEEEKKYSDSLEKQVREE